jgi:UDP-N-acetyl-D-glucosamine dehydrogenase
MKNKILNLIKKKNCVVGVVGLGYVGLDLLITLSKNKIKLLGFDIDNEKIKKIKKNISYVNYIKNEQIKILNKYTKIYSTFSKISDCDLIIICLPTPLNKSREPDLSAIKKIIKDIDIYLKKGQTIILESTTYPGTTEDIIIKKLDKKFKIGKNFFIGYSPERVDPGRKTLNIDIPKIVSGKTTNCLNIINSFYSIFFKTVKVKNIETAEITKLYENIYRSVNIGLANEMKIICNKLSINVYDVIKAAKTKPFGFSAFYPGPGLGGHCVPIDPFYLSWKVKSLGLTTRFVELAGEINNNMPVWIVNKINETLNNKMLSLSNSKILIVGLAYKKNVNDLRESPSIKIYELLKNKRAKLDLFDPLFDRKEISKIFNKSKFINKINYKSIKKYDATIIITDHDIINYEKLYKFSKLIIDTRGRYNSTKKKILSI